MKEIPLTQGKVTIVDDADYEWLSLIKWHYSGYSYRNGGYAKCHPPSTYQGAPPIKMHRLLLPPKPGFQVDHINRNKLDNRRANLRYVTKGENTRNASRYDNKSGFTGVWKAGGKWSAFATFDKVRYHIGLFATVEEAAAARVDFVEAGLRGDLPKKVPGLRRDNKSGVRGISKLKTGHWFVECGKKWLGQFKSLDDAKARLQRFYESGT